MVILEDRLNDRTRNSFTAHLLAGNIHPKHPLAKSAKTAQVNGQSATKVAK